MSSNENLAHALRMKFGTSYYEPTDAQLAAIIQEITKLKNGGVVPTRSNWLWAVQAHCPSAGRHHYAGEDNSDLNTLLAFAIQAAGG